MNLISEEKFLKSRGWRTLWSEDNWVHSSAQNPDWVGTSKEKALEIEKNNDLMSVTWRQNNNKWEPVND